MTNFFSLTGRALLAGALLSSCSHSASTAPPDPAAGPAAVAAAEPSGTKADSLNGIPGHRFGEPLSAFPGLENLPDEASGYQRYVYPRTLKGDNKHAGWFGQHPEVVNDALYYFRGGKFAAFQGFARGIHRPELRAEAAVLFGPRPADSDGTVRWVGQRVLVNLAETPGNGGAATTLNVLDRAVQAAVEKAKAAQLKADNAR